MYAARTRPVTAPAALVAALMMIGPGSAAAPGPEAPVTRERYTPTADELREAYRRAPRFGRAGGRVYKDRITPHWFDNNTRFWYRNDLAGGAREFVLVDAGRGARATAF